MSSTLTCPYCNEQTPAEFNYCFHCEQQVRCLYEGCNASLFAGKSKCLKCGRSVEAASAQGQSNEYVHEIVETNKRGSYKERREFRGSDSSVQHLAYVLSAQATGRVPTPPYTPARSARPQIQIVENETGNRLDGYNAAKQLPPADTSHQDQPILTQNAPQGTSSSDAAAYFERDGELLLRRTRDFKGTSWGEQQRRFILLYTWAYPLLFGKPVPSKDHYKAAAEKAEIYDNSNFSRYVKEVSKEYLTRKSDGLTLTRDGENHVVNILAEMGDSTKLGEPYWNRDSKVDVKRSRLSKDDEIRIKDWATEEVDLGQLQIIQITRPLDYALLALWLLTIKLHKEQTVRWNEAYCYLKTKYQNMSATPEAFSKAIRNTNNGKYVRTSDDRYFLSEEGQKKVEGWVSGQPVTAAEEKEK